MKRRPFKRGGRHGRHLDGVARRGFTLIELIGVLAIIAIMASILAPNAIKAIDRAAVRAESETLKKLGEQTRQFLNTKGYLPGANGPVWSVDLADFSDLTTENVEANTRTNDRQLVFGPTNADGDVEKIVILSGMRAGLPLPVVTRAQVNTIWNVKDQDIPALLGWTSWTADPTNAEDYFLIQRVNVSAQQQRYLLILNNVSGASTSVASTSTTTGTALAPGNSTGNNGNTGNGNGNNGNGNGNGGSTGTTGGTSGTGGTTGTTGTTGTSGTGGSGGGTTTEQICFYHLTHRDGSIQSGTILPSFQVQLKAHSGSLLQLFDAPGGALVHIHKVTDSHRNFQFLPSHHWIAQ